MKYLLTYWYQEAVDSRAGFIWQQRLEQFDSLGDVAADMRVQQYMRVRQQENARSRHIWDTSDWKWRSATFEPPYKDFKLFILQEAEADMAAILAKGQADYDEAYQEADRLQKRTHEKQKAYRLKEFKRLAEEFQGDE